MLNPLIWHPYQCPGSTMAPMAAWPYGHYGDMAIVAIDTIVDPGHQYVCLREHWEADFSHKFEINAEIFFLYNLGKSFLHLFKKHQLFGISKSSGSHSLRDWKILAGLFGNFFLFRPILGHPCGACTEPKRAICTGHKPLKYFVYLSQCDKYKYILDN